MAHNHNKIIGLLMIKNESKIIQRCLGTMIDHVDAMYILDTGSTDNTIELATQFLTEKSKPFKIEIEPFRNFGYNRTISFQNAQRYCNELRFNSNNTYCIALDGDMTLFSTPKFKDTKLSLPGYTIIQETPSIKYFNTRFLRCDYNWTCIGSTHEYWNGGPIAKIDYETIHIIDIGDGGSKSDKYERDIRLLTAELAENSNNSRATFYLAQSYKDIGKYKEAISWYLKRINFTDFPEERWFAHYMIGMMYMHLKEFHEMDYWLNKAFDFHPTRSEPLYHLTRYYRGTSQNYKAYHYYLKAKDVPYPVNDVLFVEKQIYDFGLKFENTILSYYVGKDCLKITIDYMMQHLENQDICLSNLKFVTKPIQSTITPIEVPKIFGEHFNAFNICVYEYPWANIRFSNYTVPGYASKDGGPLQTKNVKYNLETGEYKVIENNKPPIYDSKIQGIEDLRIFSTNGKLMYTANNYSEYISDVTWSVIHGEYESDEFKLIESPLNVKMEKNWLHIPDTDDFVYSWGPLRIGKINDTRFEFTREIKTPLLFALFRGSAPPVIINDTLMFLVHFVEKTNPRRYYHCFVELDKTTYTPLRMSYPFIFRGYRCEFCLSMRLIDNDTIECYVSFDDSDINKITVNPSSLEWYTM
jgi:tetratricopeptide (TPR) repeat protein